MTEEELYSLSPAAIDRVLERRIRDNWDRVAKPLDGLGRFETMLARIGAILGDEQIDISRKAVLVLCADNGIVEEGVSQSGQEVTAIVAGFMGRHQTSVCRMAAFIGADVIPVDIGINSDVTLPGVRDCKLSRGTRNFRREPAMTRKQTLDAIGTGIGLVKECREKGYRLLGTGEMGIGNTTTSSAVAAALLGGEAEGFAGRGAGLDDNGLDRKRKVIREALEVYGLREASPLRVLETVGGLDIAGLVGVFIGGGVYGIPIVLDGVISGAAALLAERLVPGTKEFMLASHKGKEPALPLILQKLGLDPVLDAELALGEGTGGVMLFTLLDMALRLYETPTTFGDIAVEQYERYDTEGL